MDMGITGAIGGAIGKVGGALKPTGAKGDTAMNVVKIGTVSALAITAVAVPVYVVYRFIKGVDRFSIAVKPMSGDSAFLHGTPLIHDPTLAALSSLDMGGDEVAWRPGVDELRNGVWVRNWTGNYNFPSSENAINFVKQTFGTPPSGALQSDKSTYRIVAEQKTTTSTVTPPTDSVTETKEGSQGKTIESQTKTEVTSTPTTTTPLVTIKPYTEPAISYAGDPTLTVIDKVKAVPQSFNNMPLTHKAAVTAGIAGAIGGAVLLLSKKKK